MSLIKLGEATVIKAADLKQQNSVFYDVEILNRFEKFAAELKSIAPKAKDFLYFSAIMMHAAEAALLDADGNLKKDSNGREVTAHWEEKGDSLKWVCSDSSIKPLKNANKDIFAEAELIKAHKKWVGKPLCLDHKSSSVDMIRGLIVDTYYDHTHKRVIALCALDKVNYPDLARKVSTGYATSVSMGTAVGRAICFDCGRVARVETDFCNHMKDRSCYGEINADLNPMELSIVVNGADPNAKIRHIVAAADSISRYINVKQNELNKTAEAGEIIDESEHIAKAEEISSVLENISKEISDLKEEVDALKRGEEEEKNHEHQKANDDQKVNDQMTDSEKEKLAHVVSDIYQNLNNLRQDFNKLYKKQGEDKRMASNKLGYFQGGGDGNEPTPGKPKYEKEDAESIRNNQDKHMEQTSDLGGPDGMFPGDEQKKRELQRLASEQEGRALRRQAALSKAKEQLNSKAYFQGGGEGNEPTPGKTKYTKEDSDKIRDKDDKQMNGASPFPGVGKPDGLYGDDLKKKEMLSRAKLTAKFLKAANSNGSENPAESRWQVFADNKLILTATVNDIAGGRVEALYDSIATENFGRKILAKIRNEGFDKAASLFKGSQAAPMAAPPVTDMSAAPVADMGAPEDDGGAGDTKDNLPKLLDKAEGVLTDIREGVNALTNDSGNNLSDFDQLGSEGEEMGATASAVTLHKKLSKVLPEGMKQAAKELEACIVELKLAKNIYEKGNIKASDAGMFHELAKESCDEAKQTIADCYKLMEAFVKYAKGTEILVKQSARKREMMKKAQYMPASQQTPAQHLPGDPLDSFLGLPAAKPAVAPKAVAPKPVAHKIAPKPAVKPLDPKIDPNSDVMPDAYPGHEKVEENLINMTRDNPLRAQKAPSFSPAGAASQKADDISYADDEDSDDVNDVVKVDKDGAMSSDSPEEAGKAMKAMKAASEPKLNTKEGRAQLRAKLAEKGLVFSDMLGKAHSGGVTPQLDIKPSGDLAKVETLEETHKAMMDLATAGPKTKKMAEDIQRLVTAGKINPDSDFPGLVSHGLDADAVKYWKSYYGQAKDGGSQFANELVQEHKTQKAASEKEAYKVKIARAYELSYEMARKGMIGQDRHALNQQVSELMSFNDEGFESMKRHVDRTALQKQASIPQVGMDMMNSDVIYDAPEAGHSDLQSDLESAFSNRKY